MKTLQERIEEKEEMEFQINEDIATIVAFIKDVLGITGFVGAVGFGGYLAIQGAASLGKSIKNKWKEILSLAGIKKEKREKTKTENVVKQLESNPQVKKEENALKELRRRYEDELSDVLDAIKEMDEDGAAEKLKDLKIKNNPEVKRVIVGEIVDEYEEPPIHCGNTGNDSYKAIKKILGMQTARAAALAVQTALKHQGKS